MEPVIASLVAACALTPPAAPVTVYDQLPADSDKGYIEFYCTDCLSNFSIFHLDNDAETLITNFLIGKTVAAAAQSTDRNLRLRRLRIAQPPGEHAYMLAATSPSFKGPPLRFTASVARDSLTPMRVDFIRRTGKSLDWRPVVAGPLPLSVGPSTLQSLTAALSAPGWGTRWYAAEALITAGHPIDVHTALAQRLGELSGEDGYTQCLAHEDAFVCSLVRDQATRALKTIAGQSPSRR